MKIVEGRKVIWETDNFIIVVPPDPHISRLINNICFLSFYVGGKF